jgi:hypothetical protein
LRKDVSARKLQTAEHLNASGTVGKQDQEKTDQLIRR